ncbi:MAG: ferritin family protein [Clostridia bacterium]|nr:ferritin family protein [Clostridia bacterium]MBN2882129.1 ferritin family protein [Clostridia bacterium]
MDALEFAINLEHEGEAFYRNQADLNRDNQLYGMFVSLAEDEHMHAAILSKKANELGKLPQSNLPEDLSIYKSESYFKSEYSEVPDQLEFYRKALSKEQESIDLYTRLMSENRANEKLFEYLINQEEKHYNLIYDLITLLERVESWVESPEFGVREDY